MDVYQENEENRSNEVIYESIADFMQDPVPSANVQGYSESNFTVNKQNATNGIRQNSSYSNSISMPLTVTTNTAKRAFRTGAEKLCDTVNIVRTKFGNLSQRLRQSTRRRVQLINSPETPVAGRSRAMLGRTPTKLYSPFSIDTPYGKENTPTRRSLNRTSFKKRTPPRQGAVRRRVEVDNLPGPRISPRLNSDLHDAQMGVYELHHTADRILQSIRR